MPEKSVPSLTISILDISPDLAGESAGLETIGAPRRQARETADFLTVINRGAPAEPIGTTSAGAARRPRDETAPQRP